AAEDFVGALARQHDLKALIANMAGQDHERDGCRTHDRRFRVDDEPREGICYVVAGTTYRRVLRTEVAHHRFLMRALVELRIFEAHRERTKRSVRVPPDQTHEKG